MVDIQDPSAAWVHGAEYMWTASSLLRCGLSSFKAWLYTRALSTFGKACLNSSYPLPPLLITSM